jgi:two-component system, sensor histidine kinase LadS
MKGWQHPERTARLIRINFRPPHCHFAMSENLSPLFSHSLSRRWQQLGRSAVVLAVLSLAALAAQATALTLAAVSATDPPSAPLGLQMSVLTESDAELTPPQALKLARAGAFAQGTTEVINVGIGHAPVWAYLVVENGSDQPVERQLAVFPSWVDRLDVHVMVPGQEAVAWHTGDATVGAPGLDDALSYTFAQRFQPGRSEVLIRVETPDPLVLNVRLLTPQGARHIAAIERYAYGFLYGFIAALALYNLMMYLGLGRRSHLYYAVYMLAFIIMDMAHTGRGLFWWWSEYVVFQRYINLVLMMTLACAGLRFAREFLELDVRSPLLSRWVRGFSWSMSLGMLVLVVLGQQEAAAWLAFVAGSLFSYVMLGLGIFAVRRRHDAAGYFLLGATASMVGVGMNIFAVFGVIPFTAFTSHGTALGMMLDAVLLALALSKFVRMQMLGRESAEREAQRDPLTGVFNRRGFYEQAKLPCQLAARQGRPLSLVVIDLDHFKAVNDQHGHHVGDEVLKAVAGALAATLRQSDILARWGGEEFILLLPETTIDVALTLAERLRLQVEQTRIPSGTTSIAVTASFGLGQLANAEEFDTLIDRVDEALYLAKSSGRNRVTVSENRRPHPDEDLSAVGV